MKQITTIIYRYGIFGLIRLLANLCITRLFFRECRLIRGPIYIRGRRNIDLGRGLTTGICARLDAFSDNSNVKLLVFGDNVEINDFVHIAAIESVKIGDNTLIASRVFITDHGHGSFDSDLLENSPKTRPSERPLFSKSVSIGRNVWIGEQVCILPGVSIGDGAVIGAGSVVSRSVPAGCVAIGNPARVRRCFDEVSGTWKRK